MLHGRAVDLRQLRRKRADDEPPGLVPKNWRLVRRSPDGREDVLADGVLAYDVGPAGDVVYTDGTRVTHLDPDGRHHRLCADDLVERVVILPAQADGAQPLGPGDT